MICAKNANIWALNYCKKRKDFSAEKSFFIISIESSSLSRVANTSTTLATQASSPTTRSSTSKRSQENLFRVEVLDRIFRLLWPNAALSQLMCPLSLERPVFRSILPNTSRGNKYCLAQHFSNASENHLLETTPRNTHWCEWLVFLRGSCGEVSCEARQY